jgi:hypothetical protein
MTAFAQIERRLINTVESFRKMSAELSRLYKKSHDLYKDNKRLERELMYLLQDKDVQEIIKKRKREEDAYINEVIKQFERAEASK